MNVSETIKTRTSLRVYDDRMIADSDLDQILEAAFLAPTAGNQQLYSIIVIKSQETKDKLSKSCDNQPFIAKAPVLLLFLADQQKWFDYYRSKGCMEFAAREEGLSWEEPNESDLLLSIEDTMIAAQNAVLMAESATLEIFWKIMSTTKSCFSSQITQFPFPFCAWDIIRKATSVYTEKDLTRNT